MWSGIPGGPGVQREPRASLPRNQESTKGREAGVLPGAPPFFLWARSPPGMPLLPSPPRTKMPKKGSPQNQNINSLTPTALHDVMMWYTDNKNHKTTTVVDVASTQVQDLELGFVEPHEVHLGPLLKPG